MSKDIVVQLKGEPQELNGVEKLELNGVGDDISSTWVPEDETELTDANITANGSYSASSFGAYGWRRVVVDVPMELSGTTPKGETWSVSMTADDRPKLTISGRS